ncbi:MAG: phosphatase PAP2 family protein, partial [Abditibacteriaceae bacterium]
EEMRIQFNPIKDSVGWNRLLLFELFFGILFPLLIFITLGAALWERGGFQWDITVLHFIHYYATPQRDSVMVFITSLGNARFIIPATIVCAVLFARYRRLREASFLLLTVGGSAALNVMLKGLFHRARPDLWVSPLPEFGYSFPSGHSMLSMALALVLVVLIWQTRWRWSVTVVNGVYVLAVGLSRLYLGVHYPSDVLAGWCISIAWVSSLTLSSGSRKITAFVRKTSYYGSDVNPQI